MEQRSYLANRSGSANGELRLFSVESGRSVEFGPEAAAVLEIVRSAEGMCRCLGSVWVDESRVLFGGAVEINVRYHADARAYADEVFKIQLQRAIREDNAKRASRNDLPRGCHA
jgi:hypothetical protein